MSDKHYDPLDHEPMPEGEEEAPRFTHTMAIVRWVLLGAMSLFAVIMILSYFGVLSSGSSGGAQQYHCPMHPTYISNQPGDCPICGMSLVPIESSGDTTAMSSESHAEHGEQMQSAAKPGQYTCPMHPEVVSDEPGDCPKCGMFLEQVKEDGSAGHDMSGLGSAPVPGLVPVTIESQRLQLINLRTSKVEKRNLDNVLRLTGFITPDETKVANLHVRVNGWVNELSVDQTGQFVKADQPLLTLYSPELYQADQDFVIAWNAAKSSTGDSALMGMRNSVLDAARDRLRLLGLSDAEIDSRDNSESPRQEIVLRSPFSGYVLEKAVYKGQYVGPDQNLFTIADLSNIWVIAEVYERDLPHVKIGQKVRMTLAAFPGETFNGRIGFIYPSVSERTRTLKVRLEFANKGLKLRPGMYAEVNLERGNGGVLAVPAEAVLDGGEVQYAFVVHGGTHFEPRLLTIGDRSDEWMEVLSGLEEGEEVVTSANFLIDSESRLKAAIAGMGGAQAGSHEGHGQ